MKKRYFTILMGIILFLSFAIMIYQAVLSNKNKSKNLDEAKSKLYENVQNREVVKLNPNVDFEVTEDGLGIPSSVNGLVLPDGCFYNKENDITDGNIVIGTFEVKDEVEDLEDDSYYEEFAPVSDDNDDEYLYKKTDISTEYLSQEDLDDLSGGIEVVGLEELNKILEDFE